MPASTGIIKQKKDARAFVEKQPPNRRAFKRMAPFGGKSFAILWRLSDNLHARSS